MPRRILLWSILLWAPTIFTTRSLFMDTVLLHAWPHQTFIAESLIRGEPPTWNPFINLGHPVWANPQTFPTNPLAMPFHAFTFPTALRVTLILVTALAACGAWLAARRFGLRAGGAALAACVYSGNGFFIAHAGFLSNLGGLALLPWLFVPDARSRPGVIVAGLTGALLLLGGHPQMTVYALLLRALLPPRWPARRWAASAALACALAAVHLLPAAKWYPYLQRASGLAYETARDCSLSPVRAALFGALPLWNRYLTPPEEDLRIIGFSVSVAAVPLVIFGLRRAAFGPAALAAGALALAMGRYTPVFAAAWSYAPALAGFRHPAQALCVPLILAAWLAGSGLIRVGRPRHGGQGARAAWAAVVAAELVLFAWAMNPLVSDTLFSMAPGAAARIVRERGGNFLMPSSEWSFQLKTGGSSLDNWLTYRDALYPSVPAAFRIPEAASLEPVQTAAHADLLEQMSKEGPAGPLARAVSVSHVATFQAIHAPGLVQERGAPAYLYRNTAAWPIHRLEPRDRERHPGEARRFAQPATTGTFSRIRFDVDAPVPAALVTAGSWDAGWFLVDGKTVSPYARAYGNLRAAPVSPGASHPVAVYVSPGAAAGLAVTAVALAALALLGARNTLNGAHPDEKC